MKINEPTARHVRDFKSPQPQLLSIWRIGLAISAPVPAFLTSFLLRIGSFAWTVATCGWILIFLLIYLVYFPLLYKSISYGISGDKVILNTGVFSSRVIAIPVSQIQYTVVIRTVFSRVFGLSSVIIAAPGARMAISGLGAADADSLAALLRR